MRFQLEGAAAPDPPSPQTDRARRAPPRLALRARLRAARREPLQAVHFSTGLDTRTRIAAAGAECVRLRTGVSPLLCPARRRTFLERLARLGHERRARGLNPQEPPRNHRQHPPIARRDAAANRHNCSRIPVPENRGVPGSSPGLATLKRPCKAGPFCCRKSSRLGALRCHKMGSWPVHGPWLRFNASASSHESDGVVGSTGTTRSLKPRKARLFSLT
jgi:hypothetical protein